MSYDKYKLSSSEKNEAEYLYYGICAYVESIKLPGETNKEFYVGITGTEDEDGDGKVDRYKGNIQKHPNMDVGSRRVFRVKTYNEEIAKAVEAMLRDSGFDTGEKIQGNNADKVYVYRKVKPGVKK